MSWENDWQTQPARKPRVDSSWSDPERGTAFDGSSSPDASSEPAAAAGAPMLVVGGALALALLGLVLGLVSDAVPVAIAGWFLAGPLAISMLGVFLHVDTTRRASPLYADSGVGTWLLRVTVVLSLVAVLVNAYPVAETVARA